MFCLYKDIKSIYKHHSIIFFVFMRYMYKPVLFSQHTYNYTYKRTNINAHITDIYSMRHVVHISVLTRICRNHCIVGKGVPSIFRVAFVLWWILFDQPGGRNRSDPVSYFMKNIGCSILSYACAILLYV